MEKVEISTLRGEKIILCQLPGLITFDDETVRKRFLHLPDKAFKHTIFPPLSARSEQTLGPVQMPGVSLLDKKQAPSFK